MLKNFRTCFRAIINLQIFFRFFNVISFLRCDFRVLTNTFKIKNDPELVLGPQTHSVFFEFIFFSRDFMVSNICVRRFPKLVLVAYHKFQELMIKKLSFLRLWDYCWKCEFDTNVKIENFIITVMENNYFSIPKVHIKAQSKKKESSCNLYIIALYCCKKRRIPIYLIKTVLKRTSNAIIQHEESWLGWIVIEQVNFK